MLHRLEHSLGVAHLANTLASKFYRMQRRELDIRPEDVKCAEVAGGPPSSPISAQFLSK
jgi:HD superfamily phosphohydrolase